MRRGSKYLFLSPDEARRHSSQLMRTRNRPDLDLDQLDRTWAEFVRWARKLGVAFHPDLPGSAYDPPLAPTEARAYDAAMARAFRQGDHCPYRVALEVWKRYQLPRGLRRTGPLFREEQL
jgi:hypothetical protein